MIWIIVIAILALLLLSGCKKPEPTITEVKLSVPYEKYAGVNWCLPASAVMVFGYYGENISQAVVANRIMINGDASSFSLVSYARELGFSAEWKRKSIKDIEEYLREGIPLIVIQKYSTAIENTHARVIIGFDNVKRELTLHDPSGERNYKMSYKAFFDLGFDNSEMMQIIIIKKENK